MVNHYLGFLIKGMLAGGLAMLVFMLIGELFFQSDLFGGFVGHPIVWLLIMAESALWLFPVLTLGLLLIRKLVHLPKAHYLSAAACVWLALGLTTAIGYKQLYFPGRPWVLGAEYLEFLFGWFFPCLALWVAFIVFSVTLRSKIQAVENI